MRSRSTRERLLHAAYEILSEESFSRLSIERVSTRAGLARRTFFLHFDSKDQLLTEVLSYIRPAHSEAYRQLALELPEGLGPEARLTALFRRIVDVTADPAWNGHNFLRISAEFGDRRGHPAHAVVAETQLDMEHWLESELTRAACADPARLARQLMVLMNGLLITQLIHRSPAYGEAVLALIPRLFDRAEGQEPSN